MRSARGSVTYKIRVGTQLNAIPTRVTTLGSDDSALSVLMPSMGVNEPGGASWSTPFCTCTCAMLPSASAAKNTALMDRPGDLVASAVATAALVSPPIDAALRL